MEEVSWMQVGDSIGCLRSRHHACVAVSGHMQCSIVYKENGATWLSSSDVCRLLEYKDNISSVRHLIQPELQRYLKCFCTIKPSPFSILLSTNNGSLTPYSIYINVEALGILMSSDVEYVGSCQEKRNVSGYGSAVDFLYKVVEGKYLMPPTAKNQKIFAG